eukprot:TRINITY_DN9176_c0_g1_i1.p1 TRINITY_DN9176_c0_g1~~TRINITY_DN9176_c0_g1_i1.p1  ORF type:complete len:127 (-),score=1.55 TRINITY_DN9176_c0_g1_i1:24-404(-)
MQQGAAERTQIPSYARQHLCPAPWALSNAATAVWPFSFAALSAPPLRDRMRLSLDTAASTLAPLDRRCLGPWKSPDDMNDMNTLVIKHNKHVLLIEGGLIAPGARTKAGALPCCDGSESLVEFEDQ